MNTKARDYLSELYDEEDDIAVEIAEVWEETIA